VKCQHPTRLPTVCQTVRFGGAPGRTRTSDTRFRKPLSGYPQRFAAVRPEYAEALSGAFPVRSRSPWFAPVAVN
jgi:hypothetical protein